MKYIKNQFIKSSQENSEVINFLFAPKFNYEYKGDNLDDFDNYFTDDVLNIEDVNSSLVSIVDKFLSSNTIKLEDKLAEQVSEISVSWDKEDFNLVVSCELSSGVIAEEILPELKEVIIEQVAKNIDSEEVEKQDIFAIKSDDLVEFFSDKGDAEKRAEEIESEDYEVVEGEVTIFVSFDELKSAVVNEQAITSKRKIQSNTVTSTLPPALDIFLKDLAQMQGLFDYEDITDFSKRATDGDLKELKKLRQQANEAAEYDDEEDLERIAKNVSKIILKSSKQIKSSIYVDTDKLWEIADRYNTSKPVSGDWNTETEHELNTISKELGISKQEAKNLMIRELGFDDSMFSGIDSSRKISSVRVNELTEQEKDDLYEIEKNEAEEYYNSLDDSDKQMLRARYGIKNAKDYVKFSIVHPDKLGDDYEFINDPRMKLNSCKNVQSSHKQIKSDWEKVDMASGPIWDSSDGRWRIFEKNGKWVLRNLKYPQTKDCFYNSFEEASQKAEDIDFVIDDEVYKSLEENPDIDVESVYEKVARKVIETESFFHK